MYTHHLHIWCESIATKFHISLQIYAWGKNAGHHGRMTDIRYLETADEQHYSHSSSSATTCLHYCSSLFTIFFFEIDRREHFCKKIVRCYPPLKKIPEMKTRAPRQWAVESRLVVPRRFFQSPSAVFCLLSVTGKTFRQVTDKIA